MGSICCETKGPAVERRAKGGGQAGLGVGRMWVEVVGVRGSRRSGVGVKGERRRWIWIRGGKRRGG